MFSHICRKCGGSFDAARPQANSCSNQCRQASYRLRMRTVQRGALNRIANPGSRTHRVAGEKAHHEYYTPAAIIDPARVVLGGRIELDPASSPMANEIVQADRYYTIEDDGLTKPWLAATVWMNPPYGGHAPKFVAKLAEALVSEAVGQAIALLGTHHMNTKWMMPLLALTPIMCTPRARIRFGNTKNPPAHGSVLLGLGVDPATFRREFSSFGPVWLLS